MIVMAVGFVWAYVPMSVWGDWVFRSRWEKGYSSVRVTEFTCYYYKLFEITKISTSTLLINI